jgi:hypothetical protein
MPRPGGGNADYVSPDGALLAALQPNPLLGFLMQVAALGAFLGTLVAYWRRRTNAQFDTFPIVTRWDGGQFSGWCRVRGR